MDKESGIKVLEIANNKLYKMQRDSINSKVASKINDLACSRTEMIINCVFKDLFVDYNIRLNAILSYEVIFLHITDRFLFTHFGSEIRSIYMDGIWSKVLDLVVSAIFLVDDIDDKVGYRLYIAEQMENLNLFYSKFENIVPKDNATLADTLFWEFGKGFSETIGHPYDILVISPAAKLAYDNAIQICNYFISLISEREEGNDTGKMTIKSKASTSDYVKAKTNRHYVVIGRWGLVFGVLSIFLSTFWYVVPVTAIIFSIIGISKYDKTKNNGLWEGVIGLVLGIVFMIVGLVQYLISFGYI